MKFSEKSCEGFVEVLASKEPVPGGGGAAALCGAVGTALGNMVGSLTVGKKKYADVETEILDMKKECFSLQEELLALIDEDAEGFEPLSRAYSLPSQTKEEQDYKASVIEACSKEAAKVPLKIMECCSEGIKLAERFSQIGSKLAVSDAGCAAAVLKGALEAAALNIFINTRSMADREFAGSMNDKAEAILDEYGKIAERTYLNVKERLC